MPDTRATPAATPAPEKAPPLPKGALGWECYTCGKDLGAWVKRCTACNAFTVVPRYPPPVSKK